MGDDISGRRSTRRVVVHALDGDHVGTQHVNPGFTVSLLGGAAPYHLIPQLGLLAERERVHHHDHLATT